LFPQPATPKRVLMDTKTKTLTTSCFPAATTAPRRKCAGVVLFQNGHELPHREMVTSEKIALSSLSFWCQSSHKTTCGAQQVTNSPHTKTHADTLRHTWQVLQLWQCAWPVPCQSWSISSCSPSGLGSDGRIWTIRGEVQKTCSGIAETWRSWIPWRELKA